MTTEIRPIERSEAVAYLKVLPFANGLPHWEPAPAAWHGGPEAWPPPRSASEQQLESWVEEVMDEGVHPQDLTMVIQSLGSLYLGGMSAHVLASAGRIRPHRETALAELARTFRTDPEPFNSFVF